MATKASVFSSSKEKSIKSATSANLNQKQTSGCVVEQLEEKLKLIGVRFHFLYILSSEFVEEKTRTHTSLENILLKTAVTYCLSWDRDEADRFRLFYRTYHHEIQIKIGDSGERIGTLCAGEFKLIDSKCLRDLQKNLLSDMTSILENFYESITTSFKFQSERKTVIAHSPAHEKTLLL